MEDLPWLPPHFRFLKRKDGYISGTVQTEEELTGLLENHRRATLTSFIKWSDHTKDKSNVRHLWQVEDYCEDTPLAVTRRIILMCHHGRAPVRRVKERSLEKVPKKRSSHNRKGKKLDCPAKLFIRHVRRFDTFSVKGDSSRTRKEEAMRRLKQELAQSNPPTSSFIHVKIPLVEAHQNHPVGSGCCSSRQLHPKVRHRLQEMVVLGVTSVALVSRALKQYVLTELCAHEMQKPHKEDQAYFPSSTTIQKHIQALVARGGSAGAGGGRGGSMSADGWAEAESMPGAGGESKADGHGRKNVECAQVALREELKKVMDDSYLCADLDTLDKTTEALKNLRQSLESQCRKDDDLQ